MCCGQEADETHFIQSYFFFFKGNLLREFGGCSTEHVNQEMTNLGEGVLVFMETATPSYSSI